MEKSKTQTFEEAEILGLDFIVASVEYRKGLSQRYSYHPTFRIHAIRLLLEHVRMSVS